MKVIGIAGRAGSGKNTVAGILAAKLVDLGFSVLMDAFAVEIKHCAREAGWNGEFTPDARCKLQQCGADLRRKDPDALVILLQDRTFRGSHDFLIISDVRMKNEAEYCRHYGVLWHVFGRGGLEGDLGNDITEQLVVEDLPDQKLITSVNNAGSLEELTQHVHMAVADGRHDKDLI